MIALIDCHDGFPGCGARILDVSCSTTTTTHTSSNAFVNMTAPLQITRPDVHKLPVETLTAILSFLPDPTAPIDNTSIPHRSSLAGTATDDEDLERLGWLPAVWVSKTWRSVVLAQTQYRISIVADNERSFAVLESLSPLAVDLYVDENTWIRDKDAALSVQSVLHSYGHRLRSLRVCTVPESRHEEPEPTSELLLPNIMRDVNAPFLREFHAVGPWRHLRGGCTEPGYRDYHPRAISFPVHLSRDLRVLDIFGCTVANASALRFCAPTSVKLAASPGIWDHQEIRPDPGILSDLDDVAIERFSMPFKFHALRHLYLDEDSLPSKEAVAALGPITLPVLESLQLSGLVMQVEDAFSALVFPLSTSVELSCVWDQWRSMDICDVIAADPSSCPLHEVLATKYGASNDSVTRIELVIKDDKLTLKCLLEDGRTTLSVCLYYTSSWTQDYDFTNCELFLVGAFNLFSDIRDLVIFSPYQYESYRRADGASRRCHWYTLAARSLTNVTKVVLSTQAAIHLLEFCETRREIGQEHGIFPVLEEMELHIRSVRELSPRLILTDKAEISRLLRAEQEARAHPFRSTLKDVDSDEDRKLFRMLTEYREVAN
ncbi:hypothetical protein PENSPDRAFT_657940 [Peniophora sp. CONT]|nr:hypothetical protein PENSPDRAFT_657940 [Peniophora sp. CONT]